MPSQSASIEKLCEVLTEQNMEINSAIKRKTIKWELVVSANKNAIRKIKRLQKKLANEPEAKPKKSVKIEPEAKPNIPENEPEAKSNISKNEFKSKKSRREQEQENEYERLVKRIAQMKDDKLQQNMEDENDELISKLNQLNSVEPEPEIIEDDEDLEYFQDVDIEEFSRKQEEDNLEENQENEIMEILDEPKDDEYWDRMIAKLLNEPDWPLDKPLEKWDYGDMKYETGVC